MAAGCLRALAAAVPASVPDGVRRTESRRVYRRSLAFKYTAAIARPEFLTEAAERFGSQCIVVAIDAKQTAPNKWEVYTHGGRKPTGLDAVEWAVRMQQYGAGEILLTSMDKDGQKSGFDLALTRAVSDAVPVP